MGRTLTERGFAPIAPPPGEASRVANDRTPRVPAVLLARLPPG